MSLSIDVSEFNEQLEYDSNSRVIYQGWALPVNNATSSTASAIWKIIKFGYDANGRIISKTWANGSASRDKKWTLRATYTY